MGREATCAGWIGRRKVRVKAHLDATFVRLSGEVRLTIPFAEMRGVVARDGGLRFSCEEGCVALQLGAVQAERWARDILHPKSRLEKLGVKPEARVAAVALTDKAFMAELKGALAKPAVSSARGRYDLIFRELRDAGDLGKIEKLRAHLEPAGALWLVYEKGRTAPLPERVVREAFLATGLVDTKVVSFSPTHTAVKVVIPRGERLK
jgi:hypothetical protein